jgi:hypothetical protein|tara:strand:+ start:80 stop:451 length:372 start_codon:yes stop_codon:yes gene_type:complete
MPRNYKKAQRERDKKKRSVPAKGKKTRKTVPSNRPSGTASGKKSSREKTYLEKTNDRADLFGRTPLAYRGARPNNQGVVQRKEHALGHRGVPVTYGPKRIKPLKPKPPSPVKGRDIPLPKSNF